MYLFATDCSSANGKDCGNGMHLKPGQNPLQRFTGLFAQYPIHPGEILATATATPAERKRIRNTALTNFNIDNSGWVRGVETFPAAVRASRGLTEPLECGIEGNTRPLVTCFNYFLAMYTNSRRNGLPYIAKPVWTGLENLGLVAAIDDMLIQSDGYISLFPVWRGAMVCCGDSPRAVPPQCAHGKCSAGPASFTTLRTKGKQAFPVDTPSILSIYP